MFGFLFDKCIANDILGKFLDWTGRIALMYHFGIVQGYVMTEVILIFVHLVISYVTGLHPLNASDEYWLYDCKENPANIISMN